MQKVQQPADQTGSMTRCTGCYDVAGRVSNRARQFDRSRIRRQPQLRRRRAQLLGVRMKSLNRCVDVEGALAAQEREDSAVQRRATSCGQSKFMRPKVDRVRLDEELMYRTRLLISRLRLSVFAPVPGLAPERDSATDKRRQEASDGYENLIRIHEKKLATSTDTRRRDARSLSTQAGNDSQTPTTINWVYSTPSIAPSFLSSAFTSADTTGGYCAGNVCFPVDLPQVTVGSGSCGFGLGN